MFLTKYGHAYRPQQQWTLTLKTFMWILHSQGSWSGLHAMLGEAKETGVS